MPCPYRECGVNGQIMYDDKNRVSSRADWWHYGWNAAYFLTMCTKNREHHFGAVEDKKMILSEIGKIADTCWREIIHHARNVELGAYVVMPNHVHGILNLHGNPSNGTPPFAVGTRHALSPPKMETESSKSIDPLPRGKTFAQMRFQNPGKNTISTIIGGFKSAVSKEARRAGYGFEWQSRFNDHIILDEEEYERITLYIINNPANWKDDEFYPS